MIKFFRYIKRICKVIIGKDFFEKVDVRIYNKTFGIDCSWVIVPNLINKDSVIYSFGVGTDISFDLAIIEHFGAKAKAFDPTPQSIEWVKSQLIPSEFLLYEYGLSNYDGEAVFYPPENPDFISHSLIEKEKTKDKAFKIKVKRLRTIMKELGDDHIDLLKMDIEGAEYDVIKDMMNSNIKPSQILVEFHHRFPNVGIRKSQEAIKNLREIGYKLFSISSSGEEYSFILNNKRDI